MPDHSIGFSDHVEREFDQVENRAPESGETTVQPHGSSAAKQAWAATQAKRCIVLLGEPTLGKSWEFSHQHSELRKQGVASYLTLWRDWYPGDDLLRSVDDPEAFLEHLGSGQAVHWFVDSLDEGRLQSDAALGELLKAVDTLRKLGLLGNLHLRLSCRSMEWRVSEQESLTRRLVNAGLPEMDMVVLRLLPFSVVTMRIAARQKLDSDHQISGFIAALQARNVMPIAGHPLLLALMLADWKQSGQVKDNRTDIYAGAVDHLLRETNKTYTDRPARLIGLAERRAAAAELATRTVLGGFTNLDFPADGLPRAVLDLDEVSTPRSHVLAALATALFTPADGTARSFLHRSFADYLAARRLADGLASGWPLRRLLPLFPVEHGIPSPVRELAASLAGMSPEFRQWLIVSDPSTACLGDTLRYTPENRHALVTVLAERYRGRRWQTDVDKVGDLGATLSVEDYRNLLESSNGAAVRNMALDMIEASRRVDLDDTVVELALADGNEVWLRTRAILVISAAPELVQRHMTTLAGLLDLPFEQDVDDEIAGAVLVALYPHCLSTEQAMGALRMPRKDSLHGVYRVFWSKLFLERLPPGPADRSIALAGLRRFFAEQAQSPAQDARRGELEVQHAAISCAPLAEIVSTLVCEALDSSSGWTDAVAEDIEVLYEWSSRFGHLGRLQPLRDAIASVATRRGLLSWWLASTDAGKDVRLWELPFASTTARDEDFDVFAQACESAVADDERAAKLFRQAASTCGEFPSSARVDRLIDLADRSAALQQAWELHRWIDLESTFVRSRREPVLDFDRERDRAHNRLLEFWRGRQREILSGDTDLLMAIVHHYDSGSDFLAPFLDAFGDQLGTELREAFEAGVAVAWRDFDSLDGLWLETTSDYGSIALPNRAIAAAQGFALQDRDGCVDLSGLTAAQVEVLFWTA